MQILNFKVTKDAYNLNHALMDLSISHRNYRKYFYQDKIFVDGEIIHGKSPVYAGSTITFHIDDEFDSADQPYTPGAPEGEILFEDDLIVAMNKPAGILTHETKNFDGITFRDYAKNTFYKLGIRQQVRFINRLDLDTSGIILIAKSDLAQGLYSKIHKDTTVKEYIAICKGNLHEKTLVDLPIGRHEEIGTRRIIAPQGQGQEAHSIFTPLYNKGPYSIIKAQIKTGRTHQIRVHLMSLGIQILGDMMYGVGIDGMYRQALHSFRLRTNAGGREVDVFAEMPEDMKELIRRIF